MNKAAMLRHEAETAADVPHLTHYPMTLLPMSEGIFQQVNGTIARTAMYSVRKCFGNGIDVASGRG